MTSPLDLGLNNNKGRSSAGSRGSADSSSNNSKFGNAKRFVEFESDVLPAPRISSSHWNSAKGIQVVKRRSPVLDNPHKRQNSAGAGESGNKERPTSGTSVLKGVDAIDEEEDLNSRVDPPAYSSSNSHHSKNNNNDALSPIRGPTSHNHLQQQARTPEPMMMNQQQHYSSSSSPSPYSYSATGVTPSAERDLNNSTSNNNNNMSVNVSSAQKKKRQKTLSTANTHLYKSPVRFLNSKADDVNFVFVPKTADPIKEQLRKADAIISAIPSKSAMNIASVVDNGNPMHSSAVLDGLTRRTTLLQHDKTNSERTANAIMGCHISALLDLSRSLAITDPNASEVAKRVHEVLSSHVVKSVEEPLERVSSLYEAAKNEVSRTNEYASELRSRLLDVQGEVAQLRRQLRRRDDLISYLTDAYNLPPIFKNTVREDGAASTMAEEASPASYVNSVKNSRALLPNAKELQALEARRSARSGTSSASSSRSASRGRGGGGGGVEEERRVVLQPEQDFASMNPTQEGMSLQEQFAVKMPGGSKK